MTAHIDFAALPDAEAARLMAEKDGLSPRPYTTSLDAAVGWLDRMGLEWTRSYGTTDGVRYFMVHVFDGKTWHICYESPECPTSRALCNAGWQAIKAREASKA